MSSPVKNRLRAKHVERMVAKKLGGRRVGILGREDVLCDRFVVEVKSRKRFVAERWYDQVVKNADRDKIPIVVVHVVGKRYDDDFVILKVRDFLKLVGGDGDEEGGGYGRASSERADTR